MLDEIARFLGLRGAIPEAAVRVAAVHPAYARAIAEHRASPEALSLLLESPPAIAAEGPEREASDADDAELLSRGARAIARWLLAGAPRVSAQTHLERVSACASCPHLVTPPPRLVYDLARPLADDRAGASTCDLCGCLVDKKAWLSTEVCPASPPRWPILGRDR